LVIRQTIPDTSACSATESLTAAACARTFRLDANQGVIAVALNSGKSRRSRQKHPAFPGMACGRREIF